MADTDMIQKALSRIEEHTAEIQKWQSFVNQADILEGRDPRFTSAGPLTMSHGAAPKPGQKKWTPGSFFGKPLASAVRMILVARQEAAGEPSPASVDDIHEALAQGSFGFDTNGAENQKNSIRISLGKNSVVFVRLPGTDLFGLVEWYGARGKKPTRKATNGDKDEMVASLRKTEAAEKEGLMSE